MNFDVIVIGSGPGGYVAAIRAAQLGFKTACIEKYNTLGGTCLNVGCIPSKALLQSSEMFHQAVSEFSNHGIESSPNLNLAKMMERKATVVKNLTTGVGGLLKKNKITHLVGTGKLLGGHKVLVESKDGNTAIEGKHIILATGSKPVELPFMKFDDHHIISSTGALALDKVPKHLVVIGGGVIGLELGSVWLRLGAEVTVIEFMDRLLPPMDRALSKEMKKVLTRQGMKFHLKTRVTGATIGKDRVTVVAEDQKENKVEIVADKVLVAVGRKPYTAGLGLENTAITLDRMGRIETDDAFQTAEKGVFAIGDVVRGLMLAHKAEEEGVALAEILAGKAGHVNYNTIPNVVYTWPEIASVGKNEDELKEAGIPYRTGQFPFKANARARCLGSDSGFVKILAHEETDRILGVHIIGPNASELIQEPVLAMEYSASAEDLARTIHGHPTLSETIKEAALSVDKRPIHI